METVFNITKDMFGISVAILVMVAICAVALISWLFIYYFRIRDRFNQLPCDGHKTLIEAHHADMAKQADKLDHICEKVSTTAGQMDILMRIVAEKRGVIPRDGEALSLKQSPRRLNGNGLRIYEAINGKQFIESNRDFLFEAVTKLAPKTPLDVEMSSLAALRISSDDTRFNKIKNWVYEAPMMDFVDADGKEYKKDITLDNVLYVLSLPLRDLYLSAHPEISTNI